MIDQFQLALLSLGTSIPAILLALYILIHDRHFPTKDPGPFVPKSPLQAPVESVGVRLKRRIDKK